ncbi:MAG: hypothetical protein HQL53_10515 [Magnetococcales bacterium]|nr:hypothetical protein [Magnetococcales bacterium]
MSSLSAGKRAALAAGVLGLLMGCATPSGPPTTYFSDKAIRLEKQARASIQAREFDAALQNLQDARRTHALRDHRPGLLRAELGLARLHMITGQRQAALQAMHTAGELAKLLEDKQALYDYHLLEGKLHRKRPLPKLCTTPNPPWRRRWRSPI